MENIEQVQTEKLSNELPVELAPVEQNNQSNEINLEDVKAGKINFWSLSKRDKDRLDNEMYKELPDDDARTAFRQGWRPKELFGGKAKDGSDKPFMDYKEYLNKTTNTLPIQNERLRSIAKERDELKDQVRKLIELNKAKYEMDLFKDEQLIDSEMQDAENENDVGRYKQILEKKNNIQREKLRLKSFEEPPVAPTPNLATEEPLPPAVQPEVSEWAAKNQWIVNDPRLLSYARIKEQEMIILHPSVSMTERLEMVADEVRRNFPTNDPSPRKSVESSRNSSGFGNSPRQKTFSDLPDDERNHADQLVKKGIFKSQADFLKYYTGKFK